MRPTARFFSYGLLRTITVGGSHDTTRRGLAIISEIRNTPVDDFSEITSQIRGGATGTFRGGRLTRCHGMGHEGGARDVCTDQLIARRRGLDPTDGRTGPIHVLQCDAGRARPSSAFHAPVGPGVPPPHTHTRVLLALFGNARILARTNPEKRISHA